MNSLCLALLSILLSVLAQVFLKHGMKQVVAGNAAIGWQLIVSSLSQPAVLFGFVLYGMGAVIWLLVLARWDVSKAYPLVGIGFVLTLVLGCLFLNEHITVGRSAGVLLICAGIVLVVRS